MAGKQGTVQTRSDPAADGLHYRTLSVRLDASSGRAPFTLDREARSVEVIAATEAPVVVFDWERWEPVNEVLLMSGLKLPKSRQIPLLDAHSRWSSSDVMGSARELRAEGSELHSKVYFSSVQRAEEALTKLEEGHLTDFSIGYRVRKSIFVPKDQTQTIEGRVFSGPVRVATDWIVKELSITPIGADERAKARSRDPILLREVNETMNKKLKDFLIKRGLSPDATDDQAWTFFETLNLEREDPPVVPVAPPINNPMEQGFRHYVDEDAIRMEAAREEQSRILEIRAMCDRFECADLGDEAIRSGRSVEETRKAMLDRLMSNAKGGHGYRPPFEAGVDERDKFRSAAIDSLVMRGGIRIDKPSPGAQELRGFTLRELARECLRMSGIVSPYNPMEMVGRAIMTADLPNILSATANKFLLEGYESAPESWRTWCGVGSLPDFKASTINRVSEADDLEIVSEHSPYKYSDAKDAKETATLVTYGKLFAITRQALINDDLQAFTDIPRRMGEAASRKVGDLPYAVLTANANMADGTALFHANHSNLGSSTAITSANCITILNEAIKLLKVQKGLLGKQILNIRGEYLIAPAAIEGIWEQFFMSGQIGGASQPMLMNPYGGSRFTRAYDARLDGTSTTVHYVMGPKGKTVTVYFLNGNETPYLETREGWSVDGVEYKARIDAVAKAVDWRAMVKCPGA